MTPSSALGAPSAGSEGMYSAAATTTGPSAVLPSPSIQSATAIPPSLRPATSSDPLVHPSPRRVRTRPTSVHSVQGLRGVGGSEAGPSTRSGTRAGQGHRPGSSSGLSVRSHRDDAGAGGDAIRVVRAGSRGRGVRAEAADAEVKAGQGWWMMYRSRLNHKERDVLDRRWDECTDAELDELLGAGIGEQLRLTKTSHPAPTSSTSLANKDESTHIDTEPTTTSTDTAPSTPLGESEPLFPPSPPLPRHDELADHPMRILVRTLRDMRHAIQEVEEENRALRAELRRERQAQGSTTGQPNVASITHQSNSKASGRAGRSIGNSELPRQRGTGSAVRKRDQVSIHESISEALSTSLTSVSPLKARAASASGSLSRSRSPSPSPPITLPAASSHHAVPIPVLAPGRPAPASHSLPASVRPASPAPSASSRSIRSARSVLSPQASPAAGNATPTFTSNGMGTGTPPNGTIKKGMAGWTSGLWVWNRKSVANLRVSGSVPGKPYGSGQHRLAGSSAASLPSLIPAPNAGVSNEPPPYSPGPTSPPTPNGQMRSASFSAITSTATQEVAHDADEGVEPPSAEQIGSSPAFRAIFLSTRLLTPDPRSILSPSTPSPGLVAYLAHTLVSTARDEGIVAVDPPGSTAGGRFRAGSRGRSRAGSEASRLSLGLDRQADGQSERGRAASIMSAKSATGVAAGYGDQALAVGRSIFKGVVAATSSASGRPPSSASSSSLSQALSADLDNRETTLRPSLLSRLSSSRTLATTALSPSTSTQTIGASTYAGSGGGGAGSTPGRGRAGSISRGVGQTPFDEQLPTMELASIVPDEIKPPTMTLSRHAATVAAFAPGSTPGAEHSPYRQNGTASQGVGLGITKGKRRLATRFENGQGEVLMDRYGFIYDIQHYSLLKDASSAGLSGPSSLLGEIPRASEKKSVKEEEQEGWVERQQRIRSDSKSSSTRSPRPSLSNDANGIHRPSTSRGSSKSKVLQTKDSLEKDVRRESMESNVSPDLETSRTVVKSTIPQPRSGTPDSHRSRQSHRSALSDPRVPAASLSNPPSALMMPAPAQPTVSTVHEALFVSLKGKSLQPQPSPSTSAIHALPDAPSPPLPSSSAAPASRATIASLVSKLNELHDAHEAARKKEWDRWFARRALEGSANGLVGTSGAGLGFELSAESELGQRTLLGLDEMALRGPKGDEEQKELARLIRGGVPSIYRAQVWAECSGAKERFVPGDYADLITVYTDFVAQQQAAKQDGQRTPGSPRFKSVDAKVLNEIEKDVVRTFPSNVYFGGDGVGVDKLRRVLVAYSLYDPLTGYCQGMNMLAATLLLVFPEEEQAFHTLVALLSSPHLLPLDYFSTSLLASRADQVVLSQYVKKLLPKVWGKMEQEGVALESVSWGWFGGIFGGCLGVETLFRVWDVFFLEGHDVLFRTALAILKLAEPEILACESAADLFGVLSGMMGRTWSADRLVTLQNSFKDKVRHDDVRRRCDKARRELRAQEALAEAM